MLENNDVSNLIVKHLKYTQNRIQVHFKTKMDLVFIHSFF